MRRILMTALVAAFAPMLAMAQGNMSSGNPVSSAVRMMAGQHARVLVAGAEEMPADKYSYHPTAGQMTFGHLIVHLVMSNNFMCSAISGEKRPMVKVSDADPKAKLVAALKSSFDYCNGVLDKANDSELDAKVPFFRGEAPRAEVMIAFVADLYDHYSQMAGYLRLNGLLPPTAQHMRRRMPMKH